MITFTKILEYELRPVGVDLYDYTAQLALLQIDPPTLRKGELVTNADVVLHSTLQRSVECIARVPRTEYIPMDELREIPFDLEKMCDKETWEKYGSKIVRKRFKEMFISDALAISRDKIFSQIEFVLEECKKRKDKSITVVSHSFRMKVVEAFLVTKGEIKTKPELIENFIKDEEKTYQFGTGFVFENI